MVSPSAPMADCREAVTITPSATPRMARPAMMTACSPRAPARRAPKRRANSDASSPRIHDRGKDDRQQELQEHGTEAAHGRQEPLRHLPGIRFAPLRQLAQAVVGDVRPEPRRARADQRDELEPVRRRRQALRGDPAAPLGDLVRGAGCRRRRVPGDSSRPAPCPAQRRALSPGRAPGGRTARPFR